MSQNFAKGIMAFLFCGTVLCAFSQSSSDSHAPCPISYNRLDMPYKHEGGVSTPTVVLSFTNQTNKKIVQAKFGLNIIITQGNEVPYDHSLTFTAAQAAGAGTPCGEVPLYIDEPDPPGSTLLSGGPACDEIISSINGLSSSTINLVAGMGTVISPDETGDPNTLNVSFDYHDMTVCSSVETVVEHLDEELHDR